MDINLLDYTQIIKVIARKFPQHYRGDLINEGYLSIIDARSKFDPEKGKFEIFIKKYIYYAMLKFISVDTKTSSLDATITDVEGEITTWKDLLEDETDVELMLSDIDYLNKHMDDLTQVEGFIKRKFFIDGLSVNDIITLYSQFTNIKNPKTIRKILKK